MARGNHRRLRQRNQDPRVPGRSECLTPWKRRFDAGQEAAAAAASGLRSYPCACGAWHLTSGPEQRPVSRKGRKGASPS